jgi:hypothetical protein
MTDSERLRRRIGLCVTCEHHRVTGNRRGSRFYLCERASTDHRYRRYPPLPVLRCAGFQEREPDAWAGYQDEEPTPEG